MKSARFSLIALLALGVAACAATPDANHSQREPGLQDKYVHAINQNARSRAASVYWVNYPTDEEVAKRLKADDDDG